MHKRYEMCVCVPPFVELGSLTTANLMEKVKGLQNLAYQLGVEECEYMTCVCLSTNHKSLLDTMTIWTNPALSTRPALMQYSGVFKIFLITVRHDVSPLDGGRSLSALTAHPSRPEQHTRLQHPNAKCYKILKGKSSSQFKRGKKSAFWVLHATRVIYLNDCFGKGKETRSANAPVFDGCQI